MLFPSSLHNLIAFLTIWLVLSFASVMPLSGGRLFRFGYFLWVVVALWYAAFRINVVEASAMGRFQLPDVEITTHLLFDLLSPAVRWFGSWLVVMIPALMYVIDRAYDGVNVIGNTWQALVNLPLGGAGGPTVDPVLTLLVLAGIFFWPIVVLVVAISDFGELRHFERVLITLARSPGPYLLTVLIVAASYAVHILASMFLGATNTAGWGTAVTPGGWLLQRVLGTGVELYVSIVAAMAIGLYFRHFGHRFAWDWGQTES